HTTALLNYIKEIPICVIPPGFKYKKPSKIVFGVELSLSKDVLLNFINFASKLDAEISFCNVETNLMSLDESQILCFDDQQLLLEPDTPYDRLVQDVFIKVEKEVTNFTEYPKKRIYVLFAENVFQALKSFVKMKEATMLVLVKKKRGALEKFFHASMTKDMSMSCQVPLLVYHEK